MVYSVGCHPHIRSNDSLAGRYWVSAVLLLPSVIIKIIISRQEFFLLAALLILTAAVQIFLDLAKPERLKNFGWRQGFFVLWIFLWFLIIPEKIAIFPAVVSFVFALIFIYEFFGGLGAYPIHPVLGGVLILRLFFQQEPMIGVSESVGFFILNCASILFISFGGIYLGLQKKIRLLPAFSFIGFVISSSLVLGRSLDLELFYLVFILGFYILTDTAVSPLKAGAHLFSALGAGICAVVLMLFGSGVLLSSVLALTLWNLASQAFDHPGAARLGVKKMAHA